MALYPLALIQGKTPMTSDASDIQPIAVRSGSASASPVPPREPERRLGLALVVISLTQLMLVLDELIVNTALPHVQRARMFARRGICPPRLAILGKCTDCNAGQAG